MGGLTMVLGHEAGTSEPVRSSRLSLPIRTERLVLRAYALDDVEATLTYHGDPEVSRFLLSEPFTRTEATQAVQRRRGQTDPTGLGESLSLVVERDGQLVGDVSLKLTDDKSSTGEVGWCFDPAYAGQGFATEAARALLVVAFDGFGMHRVVAQMDARNAASARLCERLGMTREAHFRRDWWSKGEWTDTCVYAMLADDRRPGGTGDG